MLKALLFWANPRCPHNGIWQHNQLQGSRGPCSYYWFDATSFHQCNIRDGKVCILPSWTPFVKNVLTYSSSERFHPTNGPAKISSANDNSNAFSGVVKKINSYKTATHSRGAWALNVEPKCRKEKSSSWHHIHTHRQFNLVQPHYIKPVCGTICLYSLQIQTSGVSQNGSAL